MSECLSPLLWAAPHWIESSLGGRWTTSRPYYWCNYTHLRPPPPPYQKHTAAAARRSVQKVSSSLSGRHGQELCVNTKSHTSFVTMTATWLTTLSACKSAPRPRHPHCPSLPPTSRKDYVGGGCGEPLAQLLGRSSERLLHLTLIDPVRRKKSCGSTCSKLVNYHFKEVPRKGYPFEQNASIHTSKQKPGWHRALRTHRYGRGFGRKCWALNSIYPNRLTLDPRCIVTRATGSSLKSAYYC